MSSNSEEVGKIKKLQPGDKDVLMHHSPSGENVFAGQMWGLSAPSFFTVYELLDGGVLTVLHVVGRIHYIFPLT